MAEEVVRCRQYQIKMQPFSVTSDPPTRISTNVTPVSHQVKCFAPTGSSLGHVNAAYLKGEGVWLGDRNDPDIAVTSLSFTQVIARHYKSTDGGVLKASAEGPYVNAWHSKGRSDQPMWCFACRISGREAEAGIIAWHTEFIHEGDEKTFGADSMRRRASTL